MRFFLQFAAISALSPVANAFFFFGLFHRVDDLERNKWKK